MLTSARADMEHTLMNVPNKVWGRLNLYSTAIDSGAGSLSRAASVAAAAAAAASSPGIPLPLSSAEDRSSC